jgi:hypothetical protein
MKKNINYYQHFVDSHNHWKFKLLRSKLGWSGEGRFWALNNMIAAADECTIDLNRKNLKTAVMFDLNLSEDDFNNFINILSNECELILNLDGIITTETVRDNLREVMKERERARLNKKHGKHHSDNKTQNLRIYK